VGLQFVNPRLHFANQAVNYSIADPAPDCNPQVDFCEKAFLFVNRGVRCTYDLRATAKRKEKRASRGNALFSQSII
jgi:hypothetical protein